MDIERLFVHDLTVRHWPTKTTRHNDTMRDPDATPTDSEIVGWVGPAQTVERLVNGRVEERSLRPARLPIDTVLGADDQVIVDGTTYEVDGIPDVARTPDGPHHLRAQLLAVIG